MPLSAIQTLPPKVPNSLTALLQGSGQALTGALTNAVQLGRDAVNNQVQQERSLLTERRAEINLAQRRGENDQQQFNVDRAFGENQRQFGELDKDRDLDRGIRLTESKGRNALNAERLLGVREEREFNNKTKDLRMKGLQLSNKKAAFELENAPAKFAVEKKKQATAGKIADANLAKATAELKKLANTTGEQEYVETFSGNLRQALDAYQQGIDEIEGDTSGSKEDKKARKAQLLEGLNQDMETLGREAISGEVSAETSEKLIKLRDTAMVSQGYLPSLSEQKGVIAKTKLFDKITKSIESRGKNTKSIPEEVEAIVSMSLEKYTSLFYDKDLTAEQKASREAQRAKDWRDVRSLGSAAIDEYLNSLPRNAGVSAVKSLEDLMK